MFRHCSVSIGRDRKSQRSAVRSYHSGETLADDRAGCGRESTAACGRRRAAVSLTDDERAAVDDGQAALDKLLGQLAGTPTPTGPTPRQLGRHAAGLPLLQILPAPPA